MLLEAGARIDDQMPGGSTALQWAAGNGRHHLVLLLAAGANPNVLDNEGLSALDIATDRGDVPTAEALLAHGADGDNRDRDGWTPLMRARQRELTVALVQGGVDVNATSQLGWSPLTLACAAGHTEIARFLIGAGADVNISWPTAEKPLIWSSRRGDLDMVTDLLAAGADPNVGWFGISPLMWAVLHGHDRVARKLLGAGANVRLVNHEGLDVADLADRIDRPDLARWLRQLTRTFAP